MAICMRNKEKEKTFSYNNHPLIVISFTRTDLITVRGFNKVLYAKYICKVYISEDAIILKECRFEFFVIFGFITVTLVQCLTSHYNLPCCDSVCLLKVKIK